MNWRPWKRPRVAIAADIGLNPDGTLPPDPTLYPRWFADLYIPAVALSDTARLGRDAIKAGNIDLAKCTRPILCEQAWKVIVAAQEQRQGNERMH